MVFFLLMCLLLGASEQVVGAYNSLLDPGRITWWRTKWSPAAILLSANNKDSTDVTATFFLSPSTTLSSGVLEISFPTGFTVAAASGQTVEGQVVQLSVQSLSSGSDLSFTVSGVTNPSKAGAYGPFSVRTRAFPSGQQIDTNLSFACVYIAASPGLLGTPTVSLAGAVVNKVVSKSGNTLSFKFTLAVSLWRYDTFVIEIDRRWTVAQGVICTSADYAGRWNNFNGTNTASPHLLNCLVTQKGTATGQTVYIYGLAVDGIDIYQTNDNKYVDLRIAGVTTPAYVLVDNLYTWKVSTYRFGTKTALETATIGSGPAVAADSIATAVWVPTWGALSTELPQGSSFFMDLSFSITNSIPAGGSIDIAVTEDTAGDGTWGSGSNCYIVTYISRSAACAVSTNEIMITALPALEAGKTIKVRNIIKISSVPGATAKVSYIKTYQGAISAGVLIDSGSSLASFKVPEGASKLNTFGISFLDSTATAVTPVDAAGGTGNYRQGLQFTLIPSPITDLIITSQITIICPFMSAADDYAIGVPSVTYWYKDDGSTSPIDMTTGRITLTTSLPQLTYGTASNSQGSVFFAGAVGALTSGMHLLMYQPSTATSFITLPRVSNNLATAYECRATIQATGKTTHRAAARFTVTSQDWTEKTLKLPCTSHVDGVPAIISLKPGVLPLAAAGSGREYYVEVEFVATSNFNSGLTITAVNTPNKEDVLFFAVDYPHATSLPSATSAKLYTSNGSAFVSVSGLGAVATSGSAVTLYFPIGGWTPPWTLSPALRSYFLSTADPRYKQISHQATTASLTTASPSVVFPTATVVASSNTVTNGETLSKLTLNLSASSLISTSSFFYIVLPQGFTWSSSPSIANVVGAATAYTNAKYFTATSAAFKYNSALVTTSVSGTVYAIPDTGSAAGTIAISGIKSPLGTANASFSLVLAPDPVGGVCVNVKSDFLISTTTGAISSLQISPDTVKARGPEGVAVSHTASFVLQHGVVAAGNIALTVSSDWDFTADSKCEVTGIIANSAGKVACSFSGRTISISNFADFSQSPGTRVAVTISNLLPPFTASAYEFLTALVSSSGASPIDEATSFKTSTVTVTPSSLFAGADWQKVALFPPIAECKSADLYLRFALSHSIPSGGVITISSPLPFTHSSSAKDNCFLSPVFYSSCRTSGNSLEIVLGQPYAAKTALELYLDEALDSPTGNTSTSTGFTVVSKWGGVVIDADTAAVQSSQIVVAAAPSGTITPVSISLYPPNACELSTHVFTFKSSLSTALGDQFLILFPPQYDYYLGDASAWYSNEPSTYYLDCSSESLGGVTCTVDHGIAVVTTSASLAPSTDIKIALNGVRNPGFTTTGQFQIYHLSAAGTYKAVSQSAGTVTLKPMAEIIDVRSLELKDNQIRSTTTYKWRLYLADTMNSDSQLQVLFPPEYDLGKVDKKDAYTCSSTWLDNAINSTIKTQQGWNAASSCPTQGNRVMLPATNSAMTFTTTKIVTLTVEGVANPQWGRARTSVATPLDFDISDSQIWPAGGLWTSKFDFFVYRNQTNLYTSRSYPNANAAYACFYKEKRDLLVNDYNPATKSGRVVLYPGTQSQDLVIATVSESQPLAAKQILFSPITNSKTPDSGRLKFTSKTNLWILYLGQYRMKFRVAAAIDTPKGLYYIDWSSAETKQSGVDEFLYYSPPSTLVEVVPKTQNVYTFTVAQIPPVQIGFSSVPIAIAVTNAPHSNVKVSVSLQGLPPNVAVSPSELLFGPDINELFFQVQVSTAYSQGDFQVLDFTLSGTDAAAYQIPATMKVSIIPRNASVGPASVVSWGLSEATRTSVSMTLHIDQVGIVYYYLAASGSQVPSFSSLKAALSDAQSSNSVQETDPKTGETWVQFQQRIYKSHLQTQWPGKVSMSTTAATVPIAMDFLAAGTDYDLAGYVDNLDPTIVPSVKVQSFSTKPVPDCQPFTVKFTGLVAKSFENVIVREIAKVQGVDPQRIITNGYSTVGGRDLQTVSKTIFSFILLPNRFMENPIPSEQAKVTDDGKAALAGNLKSAGILSALESISNDSPISRQKPQWFSAPSLAGIMVESLTVMLRSSVAGNQCCMALLSASANPVPSQLAIGLDPSNSPAPFTCLATDLSQRTNTLEIKGLSQAMMYFIYCTASDNYPLWPTYMDGAAGGAWDPVPAIPLAVDPIPNSKAAETAVMTLVLFVIAG